MSFAFVYTANVTPKQLILTPMAVQNNSTGESSTRKVREALKMKQKEFALKLGVTQSYLSAVELGKKEITTKLSKKLIELFQVSPEWLMQGIGSMFSEPNRLLISTNVGFQSDKTNAFDPKNSQNNSLKIRSSGQPDFYTRRITESRLYKRHPEAESEGMREALALSQLGSDSDRILKYLHDTSYDRIDQVLDRVADGSLSMAAAATEIQAITGPLDQIKDYITAVETAIVEMARAAIEVVPEVYNVVGYHIHEVLSTELDNRLSLES